MKTAYEKTERSWKHPQGYMYLAPWTNGVLLRVLVRKLTESFPRGEHRRKVQMDDAIDSFVRNIEEGYKRSKTVEYLEFWGYSQGSLEELKGRVRDCLNDGLLKSQPGSSLKDLGINLEEFKGWVREHKGVLRDLETGSSKILYPPLNSFKAEDLTYEIFIELINKTEYVTRKTVDSLREKVRREEQEEKLKVARSWERKIWG